MGDMETGIGVRHIMDANMIVSQKHRKESNERNIILPSYNNVELFWERGHRLRFDYIHESIMSWESRIVSRNAWHRDRAGHT